MNITTPTCLTLSLSSSEQEQSKAKQQNVMQQQMQVSQAGSQSNSSAKNASREVLLVVPTIKSRVRVQTPDVPTPKLPKPSGLIRYLVISTTLLNGNTPGFQEKIDSCPGKHQNWIPTSH